MAPWLWQCWSVTNNAYKWLPFKVFYVQLWVGMGGYPLCRHLWESVLFHKHGSQGPNPDGWAWQQVPLPHQPFKEANFKSNSSSRPGVDGHSLWSFSLQDGNSNQCPECVIKESNVKNSSNNKYTWRTWVIKREGVEHNKKCWHNKNYFWKWGITVRHGNTDLYPHTQETEARGSRVSNHPELPWLPWPPCLAIMYSIFKQTNSCFLALPPETMATLITAIIRRDFFWNKNGRGVDWDRVSCSLGCPCLAM